MSMIYKYDSVLELGQKRTLPKVDADVQQLKTEAASYDDLAQAIAEGVNEV